MLRFSSWQEIFNALLEVSVAIRRIFTPEIILGVLRGGVIPAIILSDLLGIRRISTIGVEYYVDIALKRKKPKLTHPLSIPVENKKVLIVDDIADTGGTLQFVSDKIEELNVSDFKIATIYCKPWADLKPEFYYEERSEWIIFPWEIRETVTNVVDRFIREGKDPNEAKLTLIEAGIEENLIDRILCWRLRNDGKNR